MEALVASKTVSRSRYERGLSRMAEKGKDASSLESPEAEGAVTALAVSVLHALDEEIRSRTEGERGLRDAVASLVASGTEATTASLRRASEEVAGAELESFFARRVGRRR
jgi:predicted metalloprotease with PDZ domain